MLEVVNTVLLEARLKPSTLCTYRQPSALFPSPLYHRVLCSTKLMTIILVFTMRLIYEFYEGSWAECTQHRHRRGRVKFHGPPKLVPLIRSHLGGAVHGEGLGDADDAASRMLCPEGWVHSLTDADKMIVSNL